MIDDEPCGICGSRDDRVGSWTHADSYTFTGRAHCQCLDLLRKAKMIWYQICDDGKEYDWLFEKVGVPLDPQGNWDAWDVRFLVCEHIWRHAGKLLEWRKLVQKTMPGYGVAQCDADCAATT